MNMLGSLILLVGCMFILILLILFYITDGMETRGLRGRRSDFMI